MAEALERATIVKDGRLMGQHHWLGPRVDAWRATAQSEDVPTLNPVTGGRVVNRGRQVGRRKRVLLLGSGLVAGPAVELFTARSDLQLYIGMSHSSA